MGVVGVVGGMLCYGVVGVLCEGLPHLGCMFRIIVLHEPVAVRVHAADEGQ